MPFPLSRAGRFYLQGLELPGGVAIRQYRLSAALTMVTSTFAALKLAVRAGIHVPVTRELLDSDNKLLSLRHLAAMPLLMEEEAARQAYFGALGAS